MGRLFFIVSAILIFTTNVFGLNQSNSVETICSNTLYYDSGSSNSNYGDSESSTLTLLPCNAGEYVSVNFSVFDTEEAWDYLYIYDGDNTTNLIGIYTGTVSPGTITSTVGALTIVFSSDNNTNASGWEATISSVNTQGVSNSAITHPVTGTSTQVITCDNPYTYYDSGNASDYLDNENGVITFTPATTGKYVTIVFDRNTFSVEEYGNSDCYDYINIYDGSDVNSIFLGSYCNSNIPTTITSSDNSGALTIEFVSDGGTTESGWEACIFCSDNPGINILVQPTSGNLTKTIQCGETYTFYDHGIDKKYPVNQSSVLTICPNSAGQSIVFDITSTSYSTVCLNYQGDYFNIYDGDNVSASLITHIHDCSNSDLDYPLTATTSSGCLTFEFYSNSDTYTDYGWLADVYCASVLPIELVDFTARPNRNSIKLNWVTQVEINNEYFTIEKSTDAVNFVPIIRKNGAGNSNELIEYEANDAGTNTNTVYYRLKQTDFDGKYTYSKILSVTPSITDNIKIYPNPNNGIFKIKASNYDYYELVDMQGNIILRSSKPEVNIENPISGLYIIKLYNNSTVVTKIIIIK